ncbi:MAG: S8 family serine peptidase [Thermoanaerobaculia bacterium]
MITTTHTASILLTASLALISVSPAGAGQVQRSANPIAGKYIVVLRDGAVRPADADIHDMRPSLSDLGQSLANQNGGRVGRRFAAALDGFAISADAATAGKWAADARVAYVEEDGWVEVAAAEPAASWGLDRIDQHEGALDSLYSYYTEGAGVDLYVVDTGIRSTHAEFQGRVDLGAAFSTVMDGLGTEDCNGHGTHVAGIAGGATFGVAKGVTLHPVRVLDCYGRGAVSDLVAGIDWITARYPKPRKNQAPQPKRAVVNMSLATDWTQTLDEAVGRSIAAGISFVVAAGNRGGDACTMSPARVAGAITVGASGAGNARPTYSNYGPCVDLFAPGDSILSASIASDSATMVMAGTSMASPHVAGTVALLLSVNPWLTPADVSTLVTTAATADTLTDVGAGSPNRLLFSPFSGDGVDMAPIALFTATCSSGTCTFDAAPSVDDRGIAGYTWDFGNGRGGSGERVTARYGRNGQAQALVTLTVTDSVGQVTTFEATVQTGN